MDPREARYKGGIGRAIARTLAIYPGNSVISQRLRKRAVEDIVKVQKLTIGNSKFGRWDYDNDGKHWIIHWNQVPYELFRDKRCHPLYKEEKE